MTAATGVAKDTRPRWCWS